MPSLIFNPAIYGQGKNFKKSNGYAPHPYFPAVSNTHNTVDTSVHGRKRRIVTQGFSEATIAASETYILEHVNNLCDGLVGGIIADSKGWSEPRDMAMWSKCTTVSTLNKANEA
jgi:cytochrome P450